MSQFYSKQTVAALGINNQSVEFNRYVFIVLRYLEIKNSSKKEKNTFHCISKIHTDI